MGKMETEEEDINIDDHENEEKIEEEQDQEEEEILKSFDVHINELFEEVKGLDMVRQCSASVEYSDSQTQEPSNEEFFFEDDVKINNPVVSKTQEKIAEEMFTEVIQKNTPPEFRTRFKFFDFYQIVPYFLSLGRQTEDRYQSFVLEKLKVSEDFLKDFEANNNSQSVKNHVLRNVGNGTAGGMKFQSLKERILKEKDTLFLIAIDEAHYAPIPKKQIDMLINDKEVIEACNTIVLQVSGTPYNLVTKNTRIKEENQYDMYKSEYIQETQYYGVGEYVDETEKFEDENPAGTSLGSTEKLELHPGTFTDDRILENVVKKNSELNEFVAKTMKEANIPKKCKTEGKIETTTRFMGHLIQYFGALIKKRLGRDCLSYLSRFQSKIGQFISFALTVTDEVMVEMDKNKN